MRKIIVLLMLIVIPSVVLAQTGRKVSDRTLLTSPTADDLVDCVDTGSSTSYKCTMGGIVALADNVNWSTMDTISTVNNSDRFVVNSSGTNKSINWDTFEDVITDNINWTSVDSMQIQSEGINWSSLNQDIQYYGINWTSANMTITSTGQVGIGTSLPGNGAGSTAGGAIFDVSDTDANSSTNSLKSAWFKKVTTKTNTPVTALRIAAQSTGPMEANTQFGPMLGFFTADDGNTFFSPVGYIGGFTGSLDNRGGVIIYYAETGNTPVEGLRLSYGGNIGIGTSNSSSQLTVEQVDAGDSFRVNDSASDGTPFIINSSGGVGIGTTSTAIRMELFGSGSFAPDVRFIKDNASNNTSEVVLDLRRMTSGTAQENLGTSMRFTIEDSAGNANEAYYIAPEWEDATDGSEDAKVLGIIMEGGSLQTNWVQSSTGLMSFNSRSSATPTAVVDIWGEGSSTGKLFQTRTSAGTIKNVIFDNGNVGIGTSSPEGALTIRLSTDDIGWTIQSSSNQACNSTCSSSCIHGWETTSGEVAVSCSDATADKCLCAGSN